ncbi:MAG: HAD family phosphatase [Clostridia bacterium]|nr:HAD family phosphatase [Clostridia bacterium]
MNCYIFDFDGTLIDSMDMWSRVIYTELDKRGVSYPDDLIKIVTPMGLIKAYEYVASLDERLSFDEVRDFLDERALYEYSYVIQPKANVIKKLKELKRLGASLNVLTACTHQFLDPCLKRVGIYDMFDNVWSTDDLGMAKSNPQIFKQVASLLKKEPNECLFFDDNIEALRTAKAAGMRAIGVYDETSALYENEIKAFADGYIKDFNEIKKPL